MLNPEFTHTIDADIDKIFRNAYPSEARYHDCNNLINRSKYALKEIQGTGFDESGIDSRTKMNYVTRICNDDMQFRYDISYFRLTTITSVEERFYITKNDAERVRLVSYRYIDGRSNAFIEYFNDAPEFSVIRSTNSEENRTEAERIVAGLEGLIPTKTQ